MGAITIFSDFGAPKIKSLTVSIASSSICHEVMGPERAKGFGIVNKEEIDIFMELYCLFHEPGDVGNFISGSSAFSKIKLKFNIQKTKIIASGPITSWQIDGQTMEKVNYLLGLQNHCRW